NGRDQLECNGKLTVDSKINEGVKLSCCGTEDCESVACEGYTVANTPKGEVACCGYADCQNKKCEGQTAVDVNGTLYACCGKENCNQVYEDNKYKTCGKEEVKTFVSTSCLYKEEYDNCNYIPQDGGGCDVSYIPYACKNKTHGNYISINYIKGYHTTCKYKCSKTSGSVTCMPNSSCETPCGNLSHGGTAPGRTTYSCTTCGNRCTSTPIYDPCKPQNKTQSRYYGQVITTDYWTCQGEKGVFTEIPYQDARGKWDTSYDYGTCDLR
ncbi:MAG: hypothetical protein U0M61_00100, partial [Succinivibrio sp.]|nr:hypothetical protein [Succinivibrio sp.]